MTEAMIRADINHRAFRVLAAVLVLRDFRSGECRATNEQIAAACGVHVSHVQRDIKALVDAGLLDRAACGPKRILTTAETAVVDATTAETAVAETAVVTPAETAVLTTAETADLHYYRDIQSIQSVSLTPACEGDQFSKAADLIDSMAPGSGLSHLPLQLRDQYPAHWYVEAARSAVVKKKLSAPYMLGILKNYARTGGPEEPAPVDATAPATAPPPRKFETYKQRAKREQRERFLARHAEINRQLDEEEARNAV